VHLISERDRDGKRRFAILWLYFLNGGQFVDFAAVVAGSRAVRCRDGNGFPHFAAFAAIAGHPVAYPAQSGFEN
jgi:hypothetical protein